MLSYATAFRIASAAVMLAALPADGAPAFDPSPYMHAQRLVDVGGHRMNLYCTGRGSPTVVLGTDGDDGTPAWRLVQPRVAERTRVCSYDAAGLGFSDAVMTKIDANTSVTDLHRLLARANVAPPFVLVGYSLSGLYARLYADRYPRDVAGMVLVAPNVPDQRARLSAVSPALAPFLARADVFLTRCAQAAERGRMRPRSTEYADCMYTPPDPTMPPRLRTLIHRQWQRPGTWRDVRAAARDTSSSRQVVSEQRDYGDLPLVVLTTTKDLAALPIPSAQKAALAHAWIAWHGEIAKLSRRGVDVVVNGSSEAIPIDRPAAVVSAIDAVIDAATGRTGR